MTYRSTIVYSLGKSCNGVKNMEAYCMKCREKREIKNAKLITMKNGKLGTQGVCPVCGTKVFRIGAVRIIEGIDMVAYEPPPTETLAGEPEEIEPPPV